MEHEDGKRIPLFYKGPGCLALTVRYVLCLIAIIFIIPCLMAWFFTTEYVVPSSVQQPQVFCISFAIYLLLSLVAFIFIARFVYKDMNRIGSVRQIDKVVPFIFFAIFLVFLFLFEVFFIANVLVNIGFALSNR